MLRATTCNTVAVLVLVLVLASASARAAELVVEWAPLAVAVESYQVERRVDDPSESFRLIARVSGDATRFSDRSVRLGVRYCYRVRGVRAERMSPPSPELCSVATEPAREPEPAPEEAAPLVPPLDT